jgi:hypothetical protein
MTFVASLPALRRKLRTGLTTHRGVLTEYFFIVKYLISQFSLVIRVRDEEASISSAREP